MEVYNALGRIPGDEKVELYKTFDNYNPITKEFVNRNRKIVEEMWQRNLKLNNVLRFSESETNLKPSNLLPEQIPDLEEFLNADPALKTIWFGHSTILINIDGVILLIDPVFSDAASPLNFVGRRFQKPVLQLNELPDIDFIVISHDHYDHLDFETIRYFVNKETTFIVPLGVGSHLESWGISSNRIVEKNWWEKAILKNIVFVSTPAQHFSGRSMLDKNKTLWSSWIIQSKNHKIFYSGDSGYDVHFKEIGDKYGPFEVAFLETGQYDDLWLEVHNSPKESIQAYKDLKANVYFPVHWGMFSLARHTWNDPILQLFKYSRQQEVNIVAPKLGQIVNFGQKFTNSFWWQESDIAECKSDKVSPIETSPSIRSKLYESP